MSVSKSMHKILEILGKWYKTLRYFVFGTILKMIIDSNIIDK